jgi:pilus assembly protein CpaB
MSKVFLENIQVLAAGQNVATDDNGKPLNVQVVTLLVTPEESQKLALASVDGKIQLALRNPLDLDHENPTAVRRENLYGASSAPPTPPPPARPVARVTRTAPRPPVVQAAPPQPMPAPVPVAAAPVRLEIQVIQGNKMEKVSFEQKEGTSAQ